MYNDSIKRAPKRGAFLLPFGRAVKPPCYRSGRCANLFRMGAGAGAHFKGAGFSPSLFKSLMAQMAFL